MLHWVKGRALGSVLKQSRLMTTARWPRRAFSLSAVSVGGIEQSLGGGSRKFQLILLCHGLIVLHWAIHRISSRTRSMPRWRPCRQRSRKICVEPRSTHQADQSAAELERVTSFYHCSTLSRLPHRNKWLYWRFRMCLDGRHVVNEYQPIWAAQLSLKIADYDLNKSFHCDGSSSVTVFRHCKGSL